MRSSATATPVRAAAAAFSVSRATAPASRSLSWESGTVEEPPVTCRPTSFIPAPASARAASAGRLSSHDAKGTPSAASAVFQ